MAAIVLTWFGGMIPRTGEQHLASIGQTRDRYATLAENTNLYSGELRPLHEPALVHQFCRPEDDCFEGYNPNIPGCRDDLPPPTIYCQPVEIIQGPQDTSGSIGQQVGLGVTLNSSRTEPVYIQWYKNGVIMEGVVQENIFVTVTAESAFDRYTVSVQNPCQTECILSAPASITVLP